MLTIKLLYDADCNPGDTSCTDYAFSDTEKATVKNKKRDKF